MKRDYKLIVSITCIVLAFAGCGKNVRILPGTYQMAAENITSDDAVFLPSLILETDNTFAFSYDPLSSYYPYGTYEVKDGILTATTQDGLYQYVFEVIDENTLKFRQDGSAEVNLTDERIGVEVSDQVEFVKGEDWQ